jgi:hypothetical protein
MHDARLTAAVRRLMREDSFKNKGELTTEEHGVARSKSRS